MEARESEPRSDIDPVTLYGTLHARYGDLEWWPANGPFEVMLGAVLTQRTAWRNAELALSRLREGGVDDPKSLLALPRNELEVRVKPSGMYRQKAARLRAMCQLVVDVSGGSVQEFLSRPAERLRDELLSVRGIGPETADSILLYAAGRPVFVVDAYTRRVLARMHIDAGTSYEQVAAWFTSELPEDAALFNNYHAMLVEVAKDHCRTVPACGGCPLGPECPTAADE